MLRRLTPVAPFAKSAPLQHRQAAGQRGGAERHQRNSQGKHFYSRCSFAAVHFLALTSARGTSSDKTQDQRLTCCGDGRQGNGGNATSISGPDCFCSSNDTAKRHGNKVNSCNSGIVSCG